MLWQYNDVSRETFPQGENVGGNDVSRETMLSGAAQGDEPGFGSRPQAKIDSLTAYSLGDQDRQTEIIDPSGKEALFGVIQGKKTLPEETDLSAVGMTAQQ